MQPGAGNLITDVAGLRVGNAHDPILRSGVTVLCADRPFTAAQMNTLELLLAGIMARWSIGPEGVIGHSDMAPGRKIDPGPRFDWARLARQGLAIQPETLGADRPLAESLTAIGYPDADPETRLQAFRLRFRQGATGPEDATDRGLASAAATAFGAFY